MEISNFETELFLIVKGLIDEARSRVSQTVNTALTILYWEIGNRINN